MKFISALLFIISISAITVCSDQGPNTDTETGSESTTTTISTTTTTTIITTTTTRTTTTTVPTSCYNNFCMCTTDWMRCEGFSSFHELDFSPSNGPGHTFQRVILIPSDSDNRLVLNDVLDFKNLTLTGTATIEMWRIKSMQLNSSPFSKLLFSGNINMVLVLIDSIFRFDYLTQPLNSICFSNLTTSASLSRFFTNVLSLYLKDSEIPEPLCSYAFRNFRLQTLSVSNLNPSSRVEFITDNTEASLDPNNLNFELNCRIDIYTIENSVLSRIDPLKNVLNYELFTRTTTITFSNSNIDYIQPDTFYYFPNVTKLRLSPSNWAQFLEDNHNTQWMYGLNFRTRINLTNSSDFSSKNRFFLYLGRTNDTYDYPEKDFCYFADFPHFRAIQAVVNFYFRGECSCTLYNIIRYSMFYPSEYDFTQSTGYSRCLTGTHSNYNESILLCDLDKRIEICKIATTKTTVLYSSTSENGQTNNVIQTSTKRSNSAFDRFSLSNYISLLTLNIGLFLMIFF